VNQRFISMVSPARYCVSGVAAGDKLNLRAYPSARSNVLQRLGRNKCGISFLPYAIGSWQKIRSSGQEGWVNKRYLSGQ
jgi:SH3-like domain-containing protein